MKPVDFKDGNSVYAEGQKEYLNLPAKKTKDGLVTSCWQLTWKERFRVLFSGHIWINQETFNTPLQPILPSVDELL